MTYDLTLRDIELSRTDHRMIEKKLSRRLQKLPRTPHVKLNLSYFAKRNQAQAQLRIILDGREYLAAGSHSNMLVAVDEALAKVDRQTVRQQTKSARRHVGYPAETTTN